MPDWADTPGELGAAVGIGAVFITVLFFLIDVRVGKVLKELKPNGGSSFSDRMTSQSDALREEMMVATERIERKIDKHIGWHMDQVSIERSKRDH